MYYVYPGARVLVFVKYYYVHDEHGKRRAFGFETENHLECVTLVVITPRIM